MADRVIHDDPVPPQPLAPWVRLAHVYHYGAHTDGLAFVRTITDHELILQLEGESWIWVEALGGHISYRPGDLLLIPPGLVHGLAQTRDAVELAVHFDLVAHPEVVGEDMVRHIADRRIGPGRPAARELWTRIRRGPTSMLIPLVTRLANPATWRERLQALADAQRGHALRDFAVELAAAGTIAWALAELVRASPAPAGPAPARARVQAILAELAHGRDTSPSIAELARRAQLSETAFREQVRSLTGASPREFLEDRRLERAARLLAETRQGVGDIARAAGYEDPFHFSRVFSRCFGRSPRAYRAACALSPQSRRPRRRRGGAGPGDR